MKKTLIIVVAVLMVFGIVSTANASNNETDLSLVEENAVLDIEDLPVVESDINKPTGIDDELIISEAAEILPDEKVVEPPSIDDQTLINDRINQYYDLRYELLSKPKNINIDSKNLLETKLNANIDNVTKMELDKNSPQKLSDLVTVDNAAQKKLVTILQMEILHKQAQTIDLSYDRYNTDINVHNVNVLGNKAVADVFIEEQIYFNADPTILSERGTWHSIKLEKLSSNWVIVDDKSSFDGYEASYDLHKVSNNESDILKEYNKEIKQDLQDQKATIVENSNAEDTLVTRNAQAVTAKTFDPSAAVAYAKKYAKTKNPTNSTNWQTYTADCTNFISIALNQSIAKDTVGSNDEHKWYWYSDSNRVPSWTGAQNFRQYIYRNNSSTSKNVGMYGKHDTLASTGLGDIVTFCSNPNNKWSVDGRAKATHCAIITTINSSGKRYISQHSYGGTSYCLDYPLADMPYNTKYYLNIIKWFKA